MLSSTFKRTMTDVIINLHIISSGVVSSLRVAVIRGISRVTRLSAAMLPSFRETFQVGIQRGFLIKHDQCSLSLHSCPDKP